MASWGKRMLQASLKKTAETKETASCKPATYIERPPDLFSEDEDLSDDRDENYVPDSCSSDSDSNVFLEVPSPRLKEVLQTANSYNQVVSTAQIVPIAPVAPTVSTASTASVASTAPVAPTAPDMPTAPNLHQGGKPKRPCIYCGIPQAQLLRHLRRKHKSEEAVQAALKLPKQEQQLAFDSLRKLGMFEKNKHLQTTWDPLLRERRKGKEIWPCAVAVRAFMIQNRYGVINKNALA